MDRQALGVVTEGNNRRSDSCGEMARAEGRRKTSSPLRIFFVAVATCPPRVDSYCKPFRFVSLFSYIEFARHDVHSNRYYKQSVLIAHTTIFLAWLTTNSTLFSPSLHFTHHRTWHLFQIARTVLPLVIDSRHPSLGATSSPTAPKLLRQIANRAQLNRASTPKRRHSYHSHCKPPRQIVRGPRESQRSHLPPNS